MTTRAFVGTNPTDERITSGCPSLVNKGRKSEADLTTLLARSGLIWGRLPALSPEIPLRSRLQDVPGQHLSRFAEILGNVAWPSRRRLSPLLLERFRKWPSGVPECVSEFAQIVPQRPRVDSCPSAACQEARWLEVSGTVAVKDRQSNLQWRRLLSSSPRPHLHSPPLWRPTLGPPLPAP